LKAPMGQGPAGMYPSGKRFVLFPALGGPTTWFPTSYTPGQVLAILKDLKPDVLHRYLIRGVARNPRAIVPGSNPPITVTEFVQASMDASNSVVVPMVSLPTFDQDKSLFYEQTQTLVALPVDPPMAFLSIDEWYPFRAVHGADSVRMMGEIADRLRGQGWKGLQVGACGAPDFPSGLTDFSLFCVNQANWEPDWGTLSRLKSVPSNGAFQLTIDWPPPMAAFSKLSGDEQARLVSGYARGQAERGYSLIYPIVLVNPKRTVDYDSMKVRTSGGETLYQVMKGLMQSYN
jgi:hypothetical protein